MSQLLHQRDPLGRGREREKSSAFPFCHQPDRPEHTQWEEPRPYNHTVRVCPDPFSVFLAVRSLCCLIFLAIQLLISKLEKLQHHPQLVTIKIKFC